MGTTTEISEGKITANGLRFGYLAAGSPEDADRPLALLLHGFPDSAWTWRLLLPELAETGYRVVAPWLRGYAPTEIPEDGCYQSGMLGLDACALHDVFEGGDRGVLVGHDWGAFAGYAAVHETTPRWRGLVALAVPPPGAIASAFLTYDQLRLSWYMFFFQHPLAEAAVGLDDLAFVERLWADWSPGYDASADLPRVKAALTDPANLAAALGYYRATLGNVGLSDDERVPALQAASAGPVTLPTLYLHGRDDGCMGVGLAQQAAGFLGHPDSRVEVVDAAGHFLHLEQPQSVNRSIVDFLGSITT